MTTGAESSKALSDGGNFLTKFRVRSRISLAALLVNVTAKMLWGATPLCIKCTMRWVMVFVFPEPAPARTKRGPSVVSTASRWSLFSPTR